MSFLKETMKCKNCKYEFNIALGTFGTGMPEVCPHCGAPKEQFENIADDWVAKNYD